MTTTALKPAGENLPPAKMPLRRVSDVRSLLVNEQARGQLSAVAAGHMNPERLMRLVANAARTTPKLYECDPMSLLGALMQCASLNLEPNNVLGHAYLIPFDNNRKVRNPDTGRDEWVKRTEVQLIVGYRGLIDLARRSGHITSLSANIHYADDEMWLYEEGTEAVLRHRPGPQQGEKLHAYAIAKFKDGGHAYVVLPWAKVMSIRDNSQGWKAASRTAAQYGKSINSPWASHEDEMAKKTAIRALAKYLPLSIEMMEAVQIDGARADFAAFAAQPADGLAIEQSDDGEETDAPVPDDQPAQIEKAAEVTAAPARSKEPAPARAGEPAAPRRRAGGAKPQEVLPLDASAAETPSIDILITSVRDWMAVDVADGATAAQVLAAWSDSLDQILKADQAKHDALVREVEGWDEAAG